MVFCEQKAFSLSSRDSLAAPLFNSKCRCCFSRIYFEALQLERHDWRKVAPDTRHPKSDPAIQDAWKKTPGRSGCTPQPRCYQRPKGKADQDEARFGRMVKIRRCWAPVPIRPMVDNGCEREFTYVYGAVSPVEGELDWMICHKMNTERMSEFLAKVSLAHAEEFMVTIMRSRPRRRHEALRCL